MLKEDISKKIHLLSQLGKLLESNNNKGFKVYEQAQAANAWFTCEHIQYAIHQIITQYLEPSKLEKWLNTYTYTSTSPKTLGLIPAGNIPLVGFHDLLCAYLSGHTVQLMLSSKDEVLLHYLLNAWSEVDPEFTKQVRIADNLKDVEALIATGSDDTHRHFAYYFKHIPTLLRKNRNSIAIIHPNDEDSVLESIADDMLMYFGMGCRNVSYLLLPENFEMQRLFTACNKYSYYREHTKYMNNYDYYRTLLLMNGKPHYCNDFLLVESNESLSSRPSVVHYRNYKNMQDVVSILKQNEEKIQCIVSSCNIEDIECVAPGHSQIPTLDTFADKVDTLQFLLNL